MATVSKKSLLRGMAVTILATAVLYGCKDFLSTRLSHRGHWIKRPLRIARAWKDLS